MRLTCPNCDAQYEVPDDVIPDAGRDVQCSNCGQTWFQHHADHLPEEEIEETGAEDDIAEPDDDDEEEAPLPPVEDETPARRQLDPAVADILRQEAEAEREARRKQQEQSPLESQPDLGIDHGDAPSERDSAQRRALEAQQRMARMRGEQEVAPEGATSSRRDLLPDIEEINSTLRKDTQRTSASTDADRDANHASSGQRNAFRTGFLVVLLIAVILALIYVYAPAIARSVPQIEPLISAYVTAIDQARGWLDDQIQSLLQWLDSMATASDS